MPDSKITALTSIGNTTDPAADPLVVVDVSDTSMAGTGTTKKVTVNGLLSTSPTASGNFTITGDLTVDTSTLKVDSANNRVGIGTASPAYLAHIRSTSPILSIQDDTSAAGGVGGTLNFIAFTSGTSGANIEAQIKGVKSSASSAGELQFFTSDSSGNSVQRFMVDGSGNLGLGVTPSAWSAGNAAIETPYGIIVGRNQASIASNAYYGGSDKYIINGFATTYLQVSGQHRWLIAPSGTAGNAITFTQAMTLDASGNLLVGTTSQVGRLTVRTATDNTTVAQFGATNRWVNFTTSANAGTDNGFFNFVSTSAAGAFSFQNANGTLWQVDNSGNMIPQITGTAPTLSANGQMVFSLTTNTNLRISVRGTDGTTRTANITLA